MTGGKRLTTHIVRHGFLWRVELFMVAATALDVEQTSSDSSDQQGIVDAEFYHRVDRGASLFQKVIQLLVQKRKLSQMSFKPVS